MRFNFDEIIDRKGTNSIKYEAGRQNPNLPEDACVEIPVLADRWGIHKMMAEPLPKHLAILVGVTAQVENLVVEACMEKNKTKVIRAVCMDPLTSAVCSLQEIHDMCEELFAVNKQYLGDYHD